MDESTKRVALRALPLMLLVIVLVYLGWRTLSPSSDTTPPESSGVVEPAVPDLPVGSAFGPLEQEWVELTGTPPEWPDDFDDPADCTAAIEELRALSSRIDQGDYAKQAGVREGTFELILDVSDALGRSAPSIGGRLDDGDAMRANVVYFLIALGPDRLAQVVKLMHSRPRMAEPLALATYRWLRAGDACPGDLAPPSADAQYEYAAFLLQTIGGQAYLRRRSPRIEALTSFYALLLADAAVARGHNPHGLDLRAEIERSKALMETQPVVFRNQYMRILGELEERWRNPQTIGPRSARR